MITFLSMPEDRARAEAIVDAMVAADLNVWNETALPGGTDWSDALVRAREARCLVICWSKAALADTLEGKLFCQAAISGCTQGSAIGVLLDSEKVPMDFDCTTYDLSGWKLDPTGWRRVLIGDAYLRDLVQAARFKQANRDPAPPSAPRKLFLRQAAVLSSAIIVPLVALASFTDVLLNFESRIAQQPSAEEQAAWDALPNGSCSALRDFVSEFSAGVYRDRADALLGAAIVSKSTVWKRQVIEDEIYLAHSSGSRAEDVQAEAKRRCELLVQGTGSRNLDVATTRVRQDCQNVGPTELCDWRGVAVCTFQEPKVVENEICNP